MVLQLSVSPLVRSSLVNWYVESYVQFVIVTFIGSELDDDDELLELELELLELLDELELELLYELELELLELEPLFLEFNAV
jgi:hypothetical protein